MKRLLLLFFLLLSVAGFTQSPKPVLYPRFSKGAGYGNDLLPLPLSA